MKICHVTSAHPEEDGRIFRRGCVSAAQNGYETYLVQRGKTYDKDGVHIIGIGIPRKNGRIYRMTSFAREAYYAARELNCDLYHLHDPELLPYARKLHRAGKAVVFDSHENYVEQIRNKTYLPSLIARTLSMLYDKYSKKVFQEIDGLTYPGNDSQESVYHGLCKRVVSTDNLPWLSEFYEKYNEEVQREPRTACYIGGLNKARGITQIIKACSMAGCKLYLAGEFESEEYKKTLEEMKEYSCVEYLGMIGREAVFELLSKVSLGICLLLEVGQYYKMQNLPTKVYEYMSMSLPVLLNDSLYNKKINKELKLGYCVDPMDVEKCSKAIRDMLDNPKLCKEFGENGRAAIRNRFCWDIEQEKLITLYKDILSEKGC